MTKTMMNNEVCPVCGGSDIIDTEEGTVTPNEIKQDFECENCGSKWEATYSPISIKVISKGD
jgi:transposase-like protein